jgi:hypothetical protein
MMGMDTFRRRQIRTYDPVGGVLMRSARADDAAVLARLSELDSQPPLDAGALIAEIDGIPVAALSLRSGRLVADPFVPTAAVCELLRIRAASLVRPAEDHRLAMKKRRLVSADSSVPSTR